MTSVLGCILFQHNIALVVRAAIVCLCGSAVTLRLLRRGVRARGSQRIGWQFLAAVAGGGGVWATHFVAMLAFEPNAAVSFDPVLTLLSLVIAMGGLFVSFLLSGLGSNKAFAGMGGAFAGLSFAAMHYTGMMAYRVVGLVEWQFEYLLASVILSVIFTAVAVSLIWRTYLGTRLYWASVALMVTGIVSLHFTGMTAFRVTPMSQNFPQVDTQAIIALALAIAVVALIVVGTGLTSFLIDTNARAVSRRQLHHVAAHDALTGLPNRSSFQAHLTRLLAGGLAADRKLAVIGIDLNRFKEINDTFGHAAGDEVLRILARRMEQCLKDDEFIARLGGDEFAAIRPFADRNEIFDFAERIEGVFSRPLKVGAMENVVGASLGAAVWPDDARSADELVNNADLAMYHAKHAFLETICFYDAKIGASVRSRRLLAEDLRQALERGELEVHYQVQMSLDPKRNILGYEALVRWTHPVLGPISPAEFIPVAEENGLIAPLGAWVLHQACEDAAKWDPEYKVAVNVSAVQFMDSNLPRLVHEALVKSGLSPRRLELELTETALVKDKVRSLHIMRQIKDLGVGLALDDFGTGYSSLETLRTFPFDKIKLDRAFVGGMEQDRQSKAIVRAVLALGKSLDIPVLAEGIETPEQMSALQQEGCDEGQGFLLGRPAQVGDLGQNGGPQRKQRQKDEPMVREAREMCRSEPEASPVAAAAAKS
jgi:diguanylate cyclase (GGDEF)-like protein